MMMSGALLHLIALFGWVQYHGRVLGANGGTGIVATICCVLGIQILSLGLQAKTYSWSRRFSSNRLLSLFYKYFSLEAGLLLGTGILLSGIIFLAFIAMRWLSADLMPMSNPSNICLSATLIMVGTNIIFSSLLVSAMSMTRQSPPDQPDHGLVG